MGREVVAFGALMARISVARARVKLETETGAHLVHGTAALVEVIGATPPLRSLRVLETSSRGDRPPHHRTRKRRNNQNLAAPLHKPPHEPQL